jgi:hypothetical protein
VSEQWAQSHEDHSAATVATITKVPLPPQKSASASLCAHPPRQATSRIRKDVASLAAQAAELHATVSSAQALGIGGGGGGKSVADIVEMTKEIQALTKKVEKLKAQKKSQVPAALTRSSIALRPNFSLCCGLNLQDAKVAELQVWEESVPTLRSMLEEAMEQKAQLQAEKEDCTRLRQGLALTWVPDAAVHKCLNCEVAFSIRKWKNHCRCSAIGRPFLLPSACLLLRFVVFMQQMWQVLRPCLLLGLHQPQVGDSVRARAAAPRAALVLFPERKIASTILMVFWALVIFSSSGNSGTTMKCR